MDVDIQIQRTAETLHDGHDPAASVRLPGRAGRVPEEAEDRPDADPDDRAAQVVVPREPVPQPMRQRQHPLPHRHPREDVVHHVRSAFRHAPPPAARTARSGLARERDQPVETTVVATEAGEATGQPSAAQKLAKFLLDEPGSPSPSRRPAACARNVSK